VLGDVDWRVPLEMHPPRAGQDVVDPGCDVPAKVESEAPADNALGQGHDFNVQHGHQGVEVWRRDPQNGLGLHGFL
jgi:hypothetical protein